MIAPGSHPKDHSRRCKCGVDGLHTYEGTTIYDAATLGLLDVSGEMHEADFVTCRACENTYIVPGVPRIDLDGESFGWVIERREWPGDARDTVPCPPPAPEAAP